MTALEQLREARDNYIMADRLVFFGGQDSAISTRKIRLQAYARWLAAVRRFWAEGRKD